MADSYVCSKAKIKCSCGDKISTLTVFPDRTICLTGEPQANIGDHIAMRNIAPFGKCHTTAYPATGSATAANHGKLTPMPCVPNTPFPWMNGKNDVLLKGQPALLKSSSCRCVYGGVITFTYDGQVDGTGSDVEIEKPASQEELDAGAEMPLSPEELLDAIQMALDAAGLFPGLGAIPDLLNACISACRGDWANAGLCLFAAIPGIGDAAGAAKLMKNGAKMAAKTKKAKAAGKSMETMSEAVAKGPDKTLASVRAKRAGINPEGGGTGSYFDSAPKHPQQKYAFGDLTKRDRFEIEEARTIDAIQGKTDPDRWSGLYREPGASSNNPFAPARDAGMNRVAPEDVVRNEALNKPKVDYRPSPPKQQEKPVLGKHLDIEA